MKVRNWTWDNETVHLIGVYALHSCIRQLGTGARARFSRLHSVGRFVDLHCIKKSIRCACNTNREEGIKKYSPDITYKRNYRSASCDINRVSEECKRRKTSHCARRDIDGGETKGLQNASVNREKLISQKHWTEPMIEGSWQRRSIWNKGWMANCGKKNFRLSTM